MVKEEPEKDYIELIKTMAKMSGADDLSAKIFAIVYAEPEEIEMEKLAKITGFSLPSISNKIKFLENTGLIKKTKKPGSRKIYLYMEKDLFKLWKDHMLRIQKEKMRIAKERFPGIIKNYKLKAKTPDKKKRLKIMENHFKIVKRFDDVMDKLTEIMK